MKDTNRKVLASSIVTAIIVWFMAWLAFAPVAPGPNVKIIQNGDQRYWVVTIDGEQWAAQEKWPISWKTNWVNLKTGKALYQHHAPHIFTLNTIDLQKIIVGWDTKQYNKRIRANVMRSNEVKGD